MKYAQLVRENSCAAVKFSPRSNSLNGHCQSMFSDLFFYRSRIQKSNMFLFTFQANEMTSTTKNKKKRIQILARVLHQLLKYSRRWSNFCIEFSITKETFELFIRCVVSAGTTDGSGFVCLLAGFSWMMPKRWQKKEKKSCKSQQMTHHGAQINYNLFSTEERERVWCIVLRLCAVKMFECIFN